MMDRPYLTYWEQSEVVAIRWFRRNSAKRDLPLKVDFPAYRRECC
jgi:hypothetical protein